MSRKSILIYWLLLLVPTVFITTAAYQLLVHEQERINRESRSSARDRARVLGETLQLSVSAVEEELTQALHVIPDHALVETLISWESRNPLIRNAYIWDPSGGLLKPGAESGATDEERQFIVRYEALFAGRVPWINAGDNTDGEPAISSGKYADSTDNAIPGKRFGKSSRASRSSRQALVEMARGQTAAKGMGQPDTGSGRQVMAGWIPWFAENRLYILGWVRKSPESLIYGVELEVMTLLSRLVMDFPPGGSVPADRVYGLVNGRGELLHQSGPAQIGPGISPEFAISLSPQLPHWQVAVFLAPDATLQKSGRGFLLLSGLLLAIFISAILLGGSLLTWQALRHQKDSRRKTSFVSNVSHELKTPLTSIRMYAELLKDNRIKSPGKKKQYLGVIVSETQRLTRLINNVLDFNRLEQGRKRYGITTEDLSLFLKDLCDTQLLQLEQNDLAPDLILPDDAPVVRVDRDALEQVMLNLMDNAAKYAADGKEVTVVLDRLDTHCRIRVMDRGPGVPGPHRRKIFDKFHRVDDSLTAVKPGSGLGLSIARKLLLDMGGDLKFEPRPGGGSVFSVLLPM